MDVEASRAVSEEPCFVLSIDLGNATMQDPTDVALALAGVQVALIDGKVAGVVLDVNGNSVGHWSFGIRGLNEPQEGQP